LIHTYIQYVLGHVSKLLSSEAVERYYVIHNTTQYAVDALCWFLLQLMMVIMIQKRLKTWMLFIYNHIKIGLLMCDQKLTV